MVHTCTTAMEARLEEGEHRLESLSHVAGGAAIDVYGSFQSNWGIPT